MPTSFYRFGSSAEPEGRWYLGAPLNPMGGEIDPRQFTQGTRADTLDGLVIQKRRHGQPIDFTLADFDMPVASERLAEVLLQHVKDSVQLLPAAVHGEQGKYFIVNAVRAIPCISDKDSLVMRWNESDGRPEKTGSYRMIAEPVLTAANHRGEPIFRAAGWEVMLLCTEALRTVVERLGFTGIEFLRIPSATSDA
jgi:hypothetical protein